MKQLPITAAEIWAVPAPSGATDFYSKIVWSEIALFFRYREQTEYVIVGDFDFEILGTATADEIDFDAALVVDKHSLENGDLYYNYTGNNFLTSSRASIRSAIIAAGYYFVNPYAEKMNANSEIKGSMVRAINKIAFAEKFEAAQSNVVEKLVIIKKVTPCNK